MILIGMFDSPYVRRVAVSQQLVGLPFEPRHWSVGGAGPCRGSANSTSLSLSRRPASPILCPPEAPMES